MRFYRYTFFAVSLSSLLVRKQSGYVNIFFSVLSKFDSNVSGKNLSDVVYLLTPSKKTIQE